MALATSTDVAQLDLGTAPTWTPRAAFPAGVNVEFIAAQDDHRVTMRVFERGVGETESCGTGTVAAARASALAAGESDGVWTIVVPGGEVEVELAGDQAWLTGPACIVARGVLDWPDATPQQQGA